MKPHNRLATRLMKWKLFSAWPGLLLAHAALATVPFYVNPNWAVLNYVIPGNPPPQIDGRNYLTPAFDNEGTFDVTFAAYTANPEYYEALNMRYYTNNGTMQADSSFSLGNLFVFGYSPGCGFQFDLLNNGQHYLADTFYNAGTIHCNSLLDNNVALFSDLGECFVSATNVVNPGVIEVGPAGLIQFTGQNVDLTRAVLDIESLQDFYTGYANLNAIGTFGTDTNAEWNPGADLGSFYAYSSWSGGVRYPGGYYVNARPSTSYFQFVWNDNGTNLITRVVFVQNTSPNAPYNVYFNGANLGLGSGEANVEWVGSSVNPADCNPVANYLYLNDNYVLGASTNNQLTTQEVPENFTFTESPTRISAGTLATAGFYPVLPALPFGQPVFPNLAFSNQYAYVSAQLIPTSVPTNASAVNASGALTNLPGRIQISASKELNLALAHITGPNYMSLASTNQFDGNAGVQIVSPYSDIHLGVTNGSLVITNLLPQTIPDWSGTVQAWSTRWLATFSNSLDGGITFFQATNDIRVMIVNSQVVPTTTPQVQDLILHATNSLVLADALNILRTLSIDAQNLTLATNGCGNGANSLDGELNLVSSAIVWQSALPNVRNLTNNGAIRTHNLVQFFGGTTNVVVIPTTPAVAATGILSELVANRNVAANNTVTIGTNTYTFVGSISNKVANQVKIAATLNGSMGNLIAAINHTAGSGTSYSTNGTTNRFVKAGSLANHSFAVTARTNGSSGNSIATAVSASTTNLTWSHATLSGGADSVAGTTNILTILIPYDNFINHGLISDQGTTIYANNFLNSGTISNGVGSFLLQSLAATLTNGAIAAGGDVTITSGSLETSNLMLQAGRKLTLQVTNFLTDDGVSNGSIWSVGGSAVGGSDSGFNLLLLPTNSAYRNDLLGTTVTNIAPPNKSITNTWAGRDYGVSAAGYTNNVAIGRLILDSRTNAAYSQLAFTGTGVSNAIYVDELFLLNYASPTNHDLSGNLPALVFNTNLVIYYAQALASGGPGGSMLSVAEYLDHRNNEHLRWVWSYAGHFSSTNIVYPDHTTNGPFNAALAQSSVIDSDGDGLVNGSDPTPFFVPSMLNLIWFPTGPGTTVSWNTVPLATNYVYWSTNVVLAPSLVNLYAHPTNNPFNNMVIGWNTVSLGTNILSYSTDMITWLLLTNFVSSQYPTALTNVTVFDPIAGPMRYYTVTVDLPSPTWYFLTNFVSPQPYPGPAANVTIFDPVPGRYYRVVVSPWLTFPF